MPRTVPRFYKFVEPMLRPGHRRCGSRVGWCLIWRETHNRTHNTKGTLNIVKPKMIFDDAGADAGKHLVPHGGPISLFSGCKLSRVAVLTRAIMA